MKLLFSIKGHRHLFLLMGCLSVIACHHQVVSETESLPQKNIYLKAPADRQYPPANLLRKLELQLKQQHYQNNHLNRINSVDTDFQQFRLENGLIVDYLSRDDLPAIAVTMIVNAGKDQEEIKNKLLSPLVLKLLKQGTSKYSKKDFQQLVSLLGEPISYRQSSQFSTVSANILAQDIDLALSLFAQQVAYIKPDKDAYEIIKQQQLLENKLVESSGIYLARQLFYRNNYPENHPYYQPAHGSKEIKNISATEIIDFYKTFYQPSQTRFIIAGDIDGDLLQSIITEYFSDWHNEREQEVNKHQQKIAIKNVPVNQYNASQFDFISRKGAQQIDLLYGMVTVPGKSPDWLALHVIATLLGGGPGSRLFADLREQQGLAYYITARQFSGRHQNPFFIQTAISPAKLLPAIDGIHRHVNYLCHNKINQQELEQIKQQLMGQIVFKLQTDQQLVANKIYQLENELGNDYLSQMLIDIEHLNAQQLFTIANQYLCGRHHIIAVGDLNSVDKKSLEKLKNSYLVSIRK